MTWIFLVSLDMTEHFLLGPYHFGYSELLQQWAASMKSTLSKPWVSSHLLVSFLLKQLLCCEHFGISMKQIPSCFWQLTSKILLKLQAQQPSFSWSTSDFCELFLSLEVPNGLGHSVLTQFCSPPVFLNWLIVR